MFGCLRRLGCLVLLIIALAAAWYWYTHMRGQSARATVGADRVWEPVTPAGAERGRMALESLAGAGGPNFVSVSAGDVASYIFFSVSNRLPASARDLQAAVIDDELAVRGVVPLRELGGRVLGPLASLVGESDTVFFSGELSVKQPEIGQYRVTELRLQQLRVPAGLIPRVLRGIDRNDRPAGVSPDALALPLPPHITDITVSNGVVTLYRSAR
ncbi:MAG TPA: hypothetical protein VMM17_03485 [Gemmatimonadaceae bacterium]|nr:hypothetical protein [Gemmatimonadaceae bacterium]